MVAGARSGGSGGNVGAAAIMAPQSAIQRSLLAYVRTQEDQADHAGVKFLTATGQSAKGMLDLFKRLTNEVLFNSRYIDPYLQSHPMPPERVAALEGLAKASPYFDRKDPPELQLRHDMMRAKLSGFLDRPDTVVSPLSARATTACRRATPAPSRPIATATCATRSPQIDGLIQARAEQSVFLRAQGSGAARRRPPGARRSRRCATR